MSSTVERILECDTVAELLEVSAEFPGLVHVATMWRGGCHCADPECFIGFLHHIIDGQWVEIDDLLVLFSRWDENKPENLDAVESSVHQWVFDFREVRGRRGALAMLSAYEDGPGCWFTNHEEEIYISPDSPPPAELLESIRRAVVLH